MHCLVAALWTADGPRAAGVVRAGADGVVLTLAKGVADRVDRRQVEHVEAHGGDARQLVLDGLERARMSVLAQRAREELVPTAEARQDGIDDHLQFPRVVRGQRA